MLGPEMLGTAAKMKGGKNLALTAGGGAAAGILATMKPWTVVKTGEVAVKTRFGRTYKEGWLARKLGKEGQPYGVLQHGFRLVPAHRAVHVNVSDNNDAVAVTVSCNGQQLNIRAAAVWGVNPTEDYAARTLSKIDKDKGQDQVRDIMLSFCASGLRDVLDGNKEGATISETEIDEKVKQKCNDNLLENYGVELRCLVLEERPQSEPQILANAIGRIASNGEAQAAALVAAFSMGASQHESSTGGLHAA